MLIHAYGLFWRTEEIDWHPERGGGRHELPRFALLGRRGSRTSHLRVTDFIDQRGIYVLYGNYGPYYAGITLDRALGVRLKEHLGDEHGNRWDRFSWFGFRNVSKGRNTLGLYELSAMAITKSVVQRKMVHEMEALLIHAMGLHNIRPGSFPAAEEWTQVRHDEREDLLGRAQVNPGRRPFRPRQLRSKSRSSR